MKTAVIYARYSSDKQTEQSIEGQLRVCKEFAERNEIVVVETYIDRAMTGTNDDRPAFQQMIKDADGALWDMVLVYALDRFGRNSIEVAVNKQKLKKNNIVLISATQKTSDNIDGSKNLDGIILENLYIGLAEYYSAELSQKVKRGMKESRAKQQFTGGYVLFGYDIVNKKYVINETEAEIIRQIFNDYLSGKTAVTILTELNNRGIKTKQDKEWIKNSIYRILRNEKYIGIVKNRGEVFNDICPPIVDTKTFNAVQKIIASNKHAPARRKAHGKFLLSGKLYCGDCGTLMTGESGTSATGVVYHYYKCFGRRKSKCEFPNVSQLKIENKVFEVCCEVLNSDFIPTIVNKAYQLQLEDVETSAAIINLEGQLTSKQTALNNIIKALESGIFTSTTQRRIEELEKDIDNISSKLEIERIKQQSIIPKEEYSTFINSFLLNQVDNDELKEALFELLIRKVVLFRDKICITFNYTHKTPREKATEIEQNILEFQEIKEEYTTGESSYLETFPAPKKTISF